MSTFLGGVGMSTTILLSGLLTPVSYLSGIFGEFSSLTELTISNVLNGGVPRIMKCKIYCDTLINF